MKIEIITSHNINSPEEMVRHTETVLESILGRFVNHISHVTVHITDISKKNEGNRGKRCLIETRVKGHQPVAVTDEADTAGQAVSRAAYKLQRSLNHALGRQNAQAG